MLWFRHVLERLLFNIFYDAYYEGAVTAQNFTETWKTINGKVEAERFEHELFRLQYQAGVTRLSGEIPLRSFTATSLEYWMRQTVCETTFIESKLKTWNYRVTVLWVSRL